MSSLADNKREVQEMAASTLSGLLKGLPNSKATAIRNQLLQQHATFFSDQKRKRGKPKTGKKIAMVMSITA